MRTDDSSFFFAKAAPHLARAETFVDGVGVEGGARQMGPLPRVFKFVIEALKA